MSQMQLEAINRRRFEAEEEMRQLNQLLDECQEAILTAIFSEDGLDAAAGEALLRKMNRWPTDGKEER